MSEENRKKEIAALWKEVFGDSDEFINTYMDNFYCIGNVLSIEHKEHLISMLHIIPFTIKDYKVAYIYAVATSPKERGKGYASLLIEGAIKEAKERGFSAILTIPANKGLRDYYSTFGFNGEFPVKFENRVDFDFGTGEKDKDIAMAIFLDGCIEMHTDEKTLLKI
ncbi:MAG: GNAT family N-acetyltransferase [Bacteroidaceae bacterium]|nr:GNAT family N-acetyltransferase [Bacteroidaceae bacterium]